MPIIRFDGPKMTKEQKETLVKGFSKVASEVTGIPVGSMVTIITENDPENVGLGDILLADRDG